MTSPKLGVFGGTFDPPHFGHLILAEEARQQLGLDRVLWLPVGVSPFKKDLQISAPNHRVAMVQAAIRDNPAFELSRVDLERPAPQYSVDTVAILQQQFPTARLYWLMGQDSLRDLPNWTRGEEFIHACEIAVLKRPGVTMDLMDLSSVFAAFPELATRLHWVNAPQMEIAAHDIRQRVKHHRSIRYFVPPAVAEYITHTGLYTD